MLPPGFHEKLQKLSDEDVMDILDAVSNEVKRRTNVRFPNMEDIRGNSVEQNLKIVLDALKNVGMNVKR